MSSMSISIATDTIVENIGAQTQANVVDMLWCCLTALLKYLCYDIITY